MSSVDNRIVRMEFDNAGFEAGAAQTIETLDRLDEALNLDGAAAGLDDLANRIGDVNMDSVSESIDNCSSRFSAFGSFVTGVFEGLGNRVADFAIGMGRNLANSLTQSARDGFDEYQLQINSIQTIAANSGASLDTITESLNQLNEYADKTVYNFSEMTANIGRFTAAGLDVEESTVAIQGFANAAALAGAGSAETSRGMYQLSQAMAAGVVKLQDWKSIQTASIDTKAFKDVIIKTARAMDATEVSVDEAIAANGDFTQSLKEGWLTAEVMSQALQVMTMSTRDGVTEQERLAQLLEMGYSEDVAKNLINIANAADDSARQVRTFKQLMDTLGEAMGSGWATTWKLIFGDFEQATQLFTDLSQRFETIIGASADARNALLKDWGDAGGRDAFVGTIFNLIEAVERPIRALADAFSDVFGMSGEQLAVLTENIARFTERLVISEDIMQGLYDFFFNVFTIIHSVLGVAGNFIRILVEVGNVVATLLAPAVSLLWTGFSALVELIARASAVMHTFSDVLEEGAYQVLNYLHDVIVDIYTIVGNLATAIQQLIAESPIGPFVAGIIEQVKEFFGIFGKSEGFFKDALKVVQDFFGGIESVLHNLATQTFSVDSIKNFVKSFADGFKNISKSIGTFGQDFYNQAKKYVEGTDILVSARNVLGNAGAIAISFKDRVVSAFKTLFDYLKTLTPEKFVTDISNAFAVVGNVISSFNPNLGEGFSKIKLKFDDILKGATEGTESFKELFDKFKTWLSERFQDLPDTVQNLFNSILDTLRYGKENVENEIGELSFGNILVNFSRVGELFNTALHGFTDGILSVPDIVSGVFGDVSGSIDKFIDKFPIKSFDDIAAIGEKIIGGGLIISLIRFASSLTNLNNTIGKVGKGIIEWPKNFGDALSKFGQGFNKWRQETKADAIVKIATALALLAGSLFLIASIPADDLERAGKAMGIMAAGLAGFLVLIGVLDKLKFLSAATLTGLGAAMTGLGVGVLALSAACVLLAQVPYDTLIKGEAAVVAIMTVLSLYAAAMNTNGGSLLKGSIGMIALAFALKLLVGSIEALGDMDEAKMEQGLKAFVEIMTMLTLFGALAAKGISDLLGAVLKFGAGVALLAVGMLVLAGAIATMSLVLNTIDNLPVVLAVMGGAIAAFVIACMLIKDADPVGVGLGLLAFSASLVVMAAAFALLSGVDMTSATVGALLMGALIAEFAIIVKKLEGLDMVTSAFAIDMFAGAVLVLAASLAIFQLVDFEKIVAGGVAVGGLLTIFGLMTKFLNAEDMLASSIAIGIFSASILVMAAAFMVLQQVDTDSISGGLVAVGLALAAFALLTAVLSPFATILPAVSMAMLAFSVSVLGLAAAFWLISEAIVNLNEVGPEQIVEVLGSFGEGLGQILDQLIERIPDFIEALVQGILKGIAALAQAAWELITSFVTTVIENLPRVAEVGAQIWDFLKNGVWPMIEGLGRIGADAFFALLNVGGELLGDVANLGKDLCTNLSENVRPVIEELRKHAADGLNAFLTEAGSHASEIIGIGQDIVSDILDGLADLVDSMIDVGEQALAGLVDALSDPFGTVAAAASNLAVSAWNTMCGVLGISSPSRVFREIGNFTVQGFILGFRDKMKDTYNVASDTAQQVPDAFADTLSNLSINVDDLLTMDYHPTVTPVINREEFDTGIDDLAAQLSITNPRVFNVSGFFKTDDPLGLSKIRDLEVRNSELIQEVKGLREEMHAYADAASQLSVIMDSGELVGSIVQQMDSELGQRQILSGRGVTR